MRRSSSIRCLSAVIGETSVTDENINNPRAQCSCPFHKKQIRSRPLLKLPQSGFVQQILSDISKVNHGGLSKPSSDESDRLSAWAKPKLILCHQLETAMC